MPHERLEAHGAWDVQGCHTDLGEQSSSSSWPRALLGIHKLFFLFMEWNQGAGLCCSTLLGDSRGKAEFHKPMVSSNGSLLIIWGCFVCVAWALLSRQLAGNGDEGTLNSLLIKDQWLYCDKIEYRCKLHLIKELNVSLTFLFCFFSATGAWPSFLRLLSFLVVLRFKFYLDYKNKLCWCFSSQVLTKSLRFCKIFKK